MIIHEPNYCNSVLGALLGLIKKPIKEIDFVDVGAGTGIWTRMVYDTGVNSTIAIEPNEDMKKGISDNNDRIIKWFSGSAEDTGLNKNSCRLITMASSFHWANFDIALNEFNGILRSNGRCQPMGSEIN